MERESLEELLLTHMLISALKRLNASIGIGDEETKQVLNELKLKTFGAKHAKQIFNYQTSNLFLVIFEQCSLQREISH
ncbi:MAG: hypothetical protein QXO77_05505, partial [Saccharolobus sp.]